jgi:hypothetical protein
MGTRCMVSRSGETGILGTKVEAEFEPGPAAAAASTAAEYAAAAATAAAAPGCSGGWRALASSGTRAPST